MRQENAVFKLSIIASFAFVIIIKTFLIGLSDQIALNLVKTSLLLIIIVVLAMKRHPKWLQSVSVILAVGLIIYHWADTCVYMAIHDRLTINNIIANYTNLDVIPYFINLKITGFSLVTFAILIFLNKKDIQLNVAAPTVSFYLYELVFITSIIFYILHARSTGAYQGSAIDLSNNFIMSSGVTDSTMNEINQQKPETIKRVNHYFNGETWQKPMPDDKPNIVVVISESLSMVDSKYSGGLYNRLPQIDKLMSDGMVFRHAVSNGKITSHGLAGSLLGIQTTKTGGFKSMLTQFPPDLFPANNIIQYAKSAGYKTIMISPGQPPSFFQMTEWFKELGFDEVYDREAKIFAGYPRFTWDAPSDGAMFEVADKMITQQKQPFFMVVETVSLHQPYILPDLKYRLGDNDFLNLVNYVDATTYEFYDRLKQSGFFKNGIFVLYGDHRRFEDLEPEEINSGGYAVWHERVICGMVGSKIKPNSVIDIPYSLVDLNVLLHHLIQAGEVDETMPMQSNLGTLFGTGAPFSISLVDDDHGTYLIRGQNSPALYLSIYDMVPLEQIQDKVYQDAATYLILNDLQMKQKLGNAVK